MESSTQLSIPCESYGGPADDSPRRPFIVYVQAILATILHATLVEQGGTPCSVDSFRLRSLYSHEQELIPMAPDLGGPSGLICSHIEALLKLSIPEDDHGPIYVSRWNSLLPGVHESGQWLINDEESVDYIFSYPLLSPCTCDGLAEYCAQLLSALLDIGELWSGDLQIFPDAVCVNGERRSLVIPAPQQAAIQGSRINGRTGTGHRHPLHSVAATEPAIILLARHWGLLAPFLNLSNTEEPIQPFRLIKPVIRNSTLVLLCYKSRFSLDNFPGPREQKWLSWPHEATAAAIERASAAF